MNQTVTLDDAKWQQVLAVIGGSTGFPWTMTNPLLSEISLQLMKQTPGAENGALGAEAEALPERRVARK